MQSLPTNSTSNRSNKASQHRAANSAITTILFLNSTQEELLQTSEPRFYTAWLIKRICLLDKATHQRTPFKDW